MYTYEINSAKRDSDFTNNEIKPHSPIVEIFSAMTRGTELSKYNKDVNDKAVNYIKELGNRASNGDTMAMSELNTLRKYTIEPALMQEIKLLGLFGTYQNLGYGETIEVETYSHEGEKSRLQAANGDVVFPIITSDKYQVPTQTVSGGFAVDYRKISMGDMQRENEGMEQVRVDIRNKASKYVIDKVYNSIKNATGVKFHAEADGITKTALDNIASNVRRFGKPSFLGDYAVVSQVNAFAPYNTTSPSFTGLSEAAMEEIRKTGLLSSYNGSAIVEIPNGFDLTKIIEVGGEKTFAPIFPAGLLFIVPQGGNSPVRTWTRGGLTSFTGNDVTTGKVVTRFDLEVAADVAKGKEYQIGLMKDTKIQ